MVVSESVPTSALSPKHTLFSAPTSGLYRLRQASDTDTWPVVERAQFFAIEATPLPAHGQGVGLCDGQARLPVRGSRTRSRPPTGSWEPSSAEPLRAPRPRSP